MFCPEIVHAVVEELVEVEPATTVIVPPNVKEEVELYQLTT